VVHGDSGSIDETEASAALDWTCMKLVQPVLSWLFEHSNDPVGDLEREMNSFLADVEVWISDLGPLP
jgi:hypothetical protein